MQPYFFPYIGYFQLIAAVDLFVVYDNIKYTKKGWISRNRILQNGKDVMLSLSLKKDSDYLDIRDRQLVSDFNGDTLLSRITGAYRGAPYFAQTFPLIETILQYDDANLFGFLHHSIVKTCEHLALTTQIRISSEIEINHELKNQEKVLALCEKVGASIYVNAVGGTELYARQEFSDRGIELKFIRSILVEYPQFGDAFVPWLSIIDAMMFNPLEALRTSIANNYELI